MFADECNILGSELWHLRLKQIGEQIEGIWPVVVAGYAFLISYGRRSHNVVAEIPLDARHHSRAIFWPSHFSHGGTAVEIELLGVCQGTRRPSLNTYG